MTQREDCENLKRGPVGWTPELEQDLSRVSGGASRDGITGCY